MDIDDSKIRGKLDELIKLGEDVYTYFQIEKTDITPSKFEYLDELDDEEFDDEDKAAQKEYFEFLEKVEKLSEQHKKLGSLSSVYQRFYTQAHRVVSVLAPERLPDFSSQYKRSRGDLKSIVDYTIYDGLMGIEAKFGAYGPGSAVGKIRNQIDILLSIRDSVGSVLFEIEQTLRMDLFDSEIESAKHLLRRGHIRASGAVLGVVLEEHLGAVARRHGFTTRKKTSTIFEYYEFLKKEEVIDTVMWRRIQGLADIRNLCDHAKDRAPTNDDVSDLLNGVERVLKTVL